MVQPTKRERIFDAIKAILDGMTDPDSPDPANPKKLFNTFYPTSLANAPAMALPAVALYDGHEKRMMRFAPIEDRQLILFVEFRFNKGGTGTNAAGLDPYSAFRYYLGLLQKALYADITLGGLCTLLEESSNTPEIVDMTDPRPGGVIVLNIQYRVKQADPYSSP